MLYRIRGLIDELIPSSISLISWISQTKSTFVYFRVIRGRASRAKSTFVGFVFSAEELSGCSHILETPIGALPIRYLGVPLVDRRLRIQDWQPVFEKVETRLGGWRARLVSRGGQLVLPKSVLAAIPIYYISIFRMPAGVRRRLEKTMRSFFWRGSRLEESRGATLMAWTTVCRPVSQGGLGIRNLQHTNMALLTKWVRRMMQPSGDLVSVVLRDVCGHSLDWEIWQTLRSGDSAFMESLRTCFPQVQRFFRSQLGDRKTFRFWENNWSGHGHLGGGIPSILRFIHGFGGFGATGLAWSMGPGPCPRPYLISRWRSCWGCKSSSPINACRRQPSKRGCGAAQASQSVLLIDYCESRGNRRTRSSCRGADWCRSVVSLWRSRYLHGSCYDDDWWRGPCGSAWPRTLLWNARCVLGRWRIARICSLHAPWPRRCGRQRVSAGLWWLRRRRSRCLSVAVHSVAKLSGRLSLPHFGPSGPIWMRSYSGVVPLPLMPSSTTRGGLRLLRTEVV